ncbi:MAG: hypothetical protein COB96_02370 [Planctomycetota bacterium]|nr:MAG: hypothetical protein COB96_02370 [Planctomycetota bacterium]
MNPLRFLFVGGGTGGHLTPAVGLAEALRARGHQTMFLTSGREVEHSYLEGVGECQSLRLDESKWPKPLALGGAMLRARRSSRGFRPDVVVSLGGLSGCAAITAKRGRPLVLLEGNRVVGKAVRLMQGFADSTFTLFADTATELQTGYFVGPISRRSLAQQDSVLSRTKFGLPVDSTVLLVCGGSQGAAQLNDFIVDRAAELAGAGVSVLALCGLGKAEALRTAAKQSGLSAVVFEHCEDMGSAYSAADFALCRGGASTIAELWLHRMPSMIVPYPWHRDRQQEHNARGLGAGAVVVDELGAREWRQLRSLLTVSAQREQMREVLAAEAPRDGLAVAVQLLEDFAVQQQ